MKQHKRQTEIELPAGWVQLTPNYRVQLWRCKEARYDVVRLDDDTWVEVTKEVAAKVHMLITNPSTVRGMLEKKRVLQEVWGGHDPFLGDA